jgi:hypothetical protein
MRQRSKLSRQSGPQAAFGVLHPDEAHGEGVEDRGRVLGAGLRGVTDAATRKVEVP